MFIPITTKIIFMKKAQTNLRAYARPQVKIIQFDFQSVLASSGNPSITNPPMEWETNENPSISNPSMPWESQKKDGPWE